MPTNLIMKKEMRNGWALVPAYANDEETIDNLKRGRWYKVTVKESRNPEFHKLGFAFLGDLFKWQNAYTDRELMRKQLSIDAGHFDHYFIKGDKICVSPRSWAFDELDELEFSELMAKIVTAAIKRFDIPPDTDWVPTIYLEDYGTQEAG